MIIGNMNGWYDDLVSPFVSAGSVLAQTYLQPQAEAIVRKEVTPTVEAAAKKEVQAQFGTIWLVGLVALGAWLILRD